MCKYFLAVICAFLLSAVCVSAQSKQDISAMQSLMDYDDHSVERQLNLDTRSAEGVLFSSMFYFYKKYISSQDGSHCTFTPSCSEYSLIAIRKKGIVMGMIDGFDRLSRCNGLSPELYHKHPTINRLYDPVE